MTATDRARDLLEAAEHTEGCIARRPCEACGAKARAKLTIFRLGFIPGTLAVAVTLAQAHEAENAAGYHFAKCSYELGGCETPSEDNEPAVYCAEYDQLIVVASGKRDAALAAWEALLPEEEAKHV